MGEIKTIPEKKVTITLPVKRKVEEEETVLVDNYEKIIIESRKKMNLTREEFAKKINEKESVIRRVESGEMRPNDALINKIEKFFDIKLKVPYEKAIMGKKETRGKLTLGDVVELKE